MSRYRPPRAKSTAVITPQGQRRLADELKHLWKVVRPEITRKVSEAAAQGDRSENAEYIYGKKALREVDARVRFLSKRLDELVVVDRVPSDRTRVYFGAWVTLEDDDGSELTYRIVGPDEFDREPRLHQRRFARRESAAEKKRRRRGRRQTTRWRRALPHPEDHLR